MRIFFFQFRKQNLSELLPIKYMQVPQVSQLRNWLIPFEIFLKSFIATHFNLTTSSTHFYSIKRTFYSTRKSKVQAHGTKNLNHRIKGGKKEEEKGNLCKVSSPARRFTHSGALPTVLEVHLQARQGDLCVVTWGGWAEAGVSRRTARQARTWLLTESREVGE